MQNVQTCVEDIVTEEETTQVSSARTPDCCIEVSML
jgi:hypothetical protein